MRIPARLSTALLVTLIATGACGRSDASRSAGAITATLALDIPGDSAHFGRIGSISVLAGAAVLPGGSIAIADQREQRLLLFDRAGKLLHQAGGTGSGPGEFRAIRWLGRCGGDSLYVWDVADNRVTVFDSALRRAREFHLPPGAWKVACNDAGELLTMASPPRTTPMPSADAPQLRTVVLMLSRTGDTIAKLESVPAGRNRPTAPVTEIARTRDHVLIGTGDSALIEQFSPMGVRAGLLRVDIADRVQTEAEYNAAIDSVYLAPIPPSLQRDRLRKLIGEIPKLARPAWYRQLLADSSGNAWVIPYWPLDSIQVAYGVAPDGKALGYIPLPRGVNVLEIGPDFLLGWRTDSNRIDHVVMYRFHRK